MARGANKSVANKDARERILDVAIDLAEAGGFDNVRQRDVAEQAGVALGTLYKRFRSKEEILSAALERETQMLELKMEHKPATGDCEAERLVAFFKITTRGLVRKPNYARAVLRAMASGEPEIAGNVASYHDRMNGLIIAAMRGVGRLSFSDPKTSRPTKRESALAEYLQQIWFASLVGWSGSLHGPAEILRMMSEAIDILLAGTDSWK